MNATVNLPRLVNMLKRDYLFIWNRIYIPLFLRNALSKLMAGNRTRNVTHLTNDVTKGTLFTNQ